LRKSLRSGAIFYFKKIAFATWGFLYLLQRKISKGEEMTMFCQGKFAVQTKKRGVNVVQDAKRRILEVNLKKAAREYYYANGNKDEKLILQREIEVFLS